MNMFKRMASIVVMAVMMLQIAVFAAPVPEDVIGTEYEGAASLLCALEIMVGDGSDFKPDDNVTRAEFAKILIKTLNLDSASEAYTPTGLFTDVPTSEWYAAPVEIGAGIGAIKGYGDGTFGPDNNVLGTEAVKMMTYACGHDITAEANGGYPAGYMATAQQIGLLKGISSIDFSQPMTRGQAAVLCANTLKVDMKKKVSEGDKIIYEQIKDVNLLSEKHDVYKAEGVISANDVTSMWEASTLREGYVQIEYGSNSGIYKAGETTIADAIGQYVRAYYKYDEDLNEGTIISYEALANRNEKTDVDLSDIDYNSVTGTKLEYWKDKDNDSRTTDIRFAETPSIIFNGASRTVNASVTETFAQIKNDGLSGEVSFLDYDGDGKVDVLNIMAYDTVVVSRIDTKNYIINKEVDTYKDGDGKVTVDVESSNMTAKIVDIDGDEMEFGDIAKGDILSIAKSDPGAREYAFIKVCNDSVEGEITEIGTDDDKFVLTIDGERYEVTDSYMHYVTKGAGINVSSSQLKIKVGTSGEFYLDSFGRIAYDKLSGVSSDAIFGFIRTYAVGKGTDDSLQFRIFADGEYMDKSAAAKVELDGTVYKSTADLQAALSNSIAKVNEHSQFYPNDKDEIGYYQMTPMLFELDSNDKIRKIDTPYRAPGESEYTLQMVAEKATIDFATGVTYLKGSSSLQGTKYKVLDSTQVISIPNEYSDIDDLKKIQAMKGTSLPTERAKAFKIMMFTTEPNSYNVEFALTQMNADATAPDGGSQTHDLQFMVVQSVTQAMTGDDDERKKTLKITGLMEGAKKEYYVDSDYYESGDFYRDIWTNATSKYPEAASVEDPRRKSEVVVEGDAIRVFTNSAGHVVWARPTYLIDAMIFKADDQNFTDSIDRYRAQDIAVLNELDGTNGRFKYLLLKDSVNGRGNTQATTRVSVDANGYVTGSASADNVDAISKSLKLYDPATQQYIFNDATIKNGMGTDESYDVTKFKVMVYDGSKGKGLKVEAGSDNDLSDTKSGEPASLVIMQFRGGSNGPTNPRGMYIIKY